MTSFICCGCNVCMMTVPHFLRIDKAAVNQDQETSLACRVIDLVVFHDRLWSCEWIVVLHPLLRWSYKNVECWVPGKCEGGDEATEERIDWWLFMFFVWTSEWLDSVVHPYTHLIRENAFRGNYLLTCDPISLLLEIKHLGARKKIKSTFAFERRSLIYYVVYMSQYWSWTLHTYSLYSLKCVVNDNYY